MIRDEIDYVTFLRTLAPRHSSGSSAGANLCSDPGDWPWSSYSALTWLQEPPTFLEVGFIHSLFDGPDGFRRFVSGGT